MTEDGHINANGGAYKGLERFAARKKIVEDLKEQGFLEKITEHVSAIGLCERSKTIVEPRASTQWFCKMKPLAEPAIEAVERGDIQIIPENRRQEFFHWMRNIRDWTISRQLWWGHRIPAWYCGDCQEVTVAREAPKKCAKCGAGELKQDPDVLDTWFSSGLWPFSTLGWPEKTADFERYYPTSLLITGYDILFFWVARMAMLGIHFTGQVPFRAVYLHSLVRTASGEKMSKSKGTGLDPVALNEQYGTDAMRFCLASMAAPGTDIVLSDDRLLGARSFANKIWNAARFLFVNLDKYEEGGAPIEALAGPETRGKAPYAGNGGVPLIDRWLFARVAETAETVNDALANYRFHEAAQSVYQFFWGDFCDWYIEWVKPELQNANRERGRGLEESVCGIRRGAAAAAPLHAVFDGRVVAPTAAAGGGKVDCAGYLSRSTDGMERCCSAGGFRIDPGSDPGNADGAGGDEAGSEEEGGGGNRERERENAQHDRGECGGHSEARKLERTEGALGEIASGRRRHAVDGGIRLADSVCGGDSGCSGGTGAAEERAGGVGKGNRFQGEAVGK